MKVYIVTMETKEETSIKGVYCNEENAHELVTLIIDASRTLDFGFVSNNETLSGEYILMQRGDEYIKIKIIEKECK